MVELIGGMSPDQQSRISIWNTSVPRGPTSPFSSLLGIDVSREARAKIHLEIENHISKAMEKIHAYT
jgi:hypothetical protein